LHKPEILPEKTGFLLVFQLLAFTGAEDSAHLSPASWTLISALRFPGAEPSLPLLCGSAATVCRYHDAIVF
jgi:hypothetical protein